MDPLQAQAIGIAVVAIVLLIAWALWGWWQDIQ